MRGVKPGRCTAVNSAPAGDLRIGHDDNEISGILNKRRRRCVMILIVKNGIKLDATVDNSAKQSDAQARYDRTAY